MELTINLFGSLILTFLGFVIPVIGILLSLYQEGMSLLSVQYENEKDQAEKNIKDQLKKIVIDTEELKESEVQVNLNKLKNIKRKAEQKLSFLQPKKQIIILFIPLALSFLCIEVAAYLAKHTINFNKITMGVAFFFIIPSFGLFLYALNRLWGLSNVIIDVKKITDEIQNNKEKEMRQVLLDISQKITKSEEKLLTNIFITINDKKINISKVEIELIAQEKKELKICVENDEKLMAKNIEVGIILPTDFIIEDTKAYNIYNLGSKQIIRHELDILHANTSIILPNLTITPLSKNSHEIKTFIKGENVGVIYRKFIFKVT